MNNHFRDMVFSRFAGYVKAVDGIVLKVRSGKAYGLVGESGCGKSTSRHGYPENA